MEYTEVVKVLVQELRKSPFCKDFNVATFDSMTREELIQVLNEVLSILDPEYAEQLTEEEDVSDHVDRITGFLRILKYRPSLEDPKRICDAIYRGEVEVFCRIMVWVLENQAELLTRSYLAKFLVEVDIPFDYARDPDIDETRQKYLSVIEEFKNAHRTYEQMKGSLTTTELIEDMKNIQHDIDCIRRKIEIARSKHVYNKNLDVLLLQVRENRKAREKLHELVKQAEYEEHRLEDSETIRSCYERTLNCLKNSYAGVHSEQSFVEAMNENCEMLKYIVLKKIPKDIDQNERQILAMKHVEVDPPKTQEELLNLVAKAQRLQDQVRELELQRLQKTNDPDLQKLRELMSQTYHLISFKSQTLEDNLSEIQSLESHRQTLVHQQAEVLGAEIRYDSDGRPVISSEEHYREVVKSVRAKAAVYKKQRGEIGLLQQEAGVLASTKFILDGEVLQSSNDLSALAENMGVPGIFDLQDRLENLSSEKSEMNEQLYSTLHGMASMSHELMNSIALKKYDLEPLIKEVKLRREELQAVQREHSSVMEAYQNVFSDVDLDSCHLVAKFQKLRTENASLCLELGVLTAETNVLKTNLERATEDQSENKYAGRQFQDKLLSKILEEERRSAALNDEISDSDLQHRHDLLAHWTSLSRLLDMKLELAKQQVEDFYP